MGTRWGSHWCPPDVQIVGCRNIHPLATRNSSWQLQLQPVCLSTRLQFAVALRSPAAPSVAVLDDLPLPPSSLLTATTTGTSHHTHHLPGFIPFAYFPLQEMLGSIKSNSLASALDWYQKKVSTLTPLLCSNCVLWLTFSLLTPLSLCVASLVPMISNFGKKRSKNGCSRVCPMRFLKNWPESKQNSSTWI